MDKLRDGKVISEPSRACEANAQESTQQIHPLQSFPDTLSNPNNPENAKYLASFEPDKKYFGFSKQNEKHFGSFQLGSKLGLREGKTEPGDMTLRQWLTRSQRTVNKYQCLHIFGQVVEAMNAAHSQGLVLRNIRPSSISLSSFNRISLIGSVNNNPGNDIYNQSAEGYLQSDQNRSAQKPSHDFKEYQRWQHAPNQKSYYDGNLDRNASVAMTSSSNVFAMKKSSEARNKKISEAGNMHIDHEEESNREKYGPFQPRQTSHMELSWYTSPEELRGVSCSFSSDVYSLGVLLFELFCTFSSEGEQCRIMSDLRHRVLPPHLLRKWPKEITFCLWLLHPEPNQRPKLSEILQSEIMDEAREVLLEWKAADKLEEEISNRDLLLDFLIQVQQRKQETAEKLYEAITCLTSDIEIVLNKQCILNHRGIMSFDFNEEEKLTINKGKKPSCLPPQLEQKNGANIITSSSILNVTPGKTGKTVMLGKRFQKGYENDAMNNGKELGKSNLKSEAKVDFIDRRSRMLNNFKELEKAYFSTRCMAKQLESDSLGKYSNGSLGQGPVIRTGGPNASLANNLAGIAQPSGGSKTEQFGSFFDSLWKYLRFSKFEVKATLRQGDLLNFSSLICSLSFDRDKEYFATAGVSKKIKVFDCDTIVNEILDIHYPVTEMTSISKLSSICWNSYIKNQIASSSFDGMVQLWDITRNQAVLDFKEHRRCVWSVDFSQTDPRQLASGGDDGCAKLWNISQGGSIGTIRTNANVCCVQFPPDSPYQLALGSADYKIYCYDLRNIKEPWCTLDGHKRAVSYVKFLDSSNIVSASTDGTLKLWDLAVSTGGVLSDPVRTFIAHKNEKNFVGLSVADGYIATGSESNEVFVYHRSIPTPVASYKFNCEDTMNGLKIDDDTGQFVSSVCWRGQSQTLVAANSKGNIKILEMV